MMPGAGKGTSVTARRWAVTGIAALAAAGFFWVAPARLRASATVRASGFATAESPGASGLGVAVLAPARAPARTDPGAAAREVLAGEDFWWKRIETKTVPTTGLQAFLARVFEYPLRGLSMLWDLIVEFVRRLWRLWRSLYGLLATGDWTGGADVIWLIAALILGWAIWKLYPFVVRWIGGIAAAPRAQAATSVSWQSLPESSDLFAQAREAFADRKYAEAIRLALLALIARLEKQGLIRYDTTRTNREYQSELCAQADLAASFGQLARIYERVWYGRAPAGPAEAEAAIDLCRLLINREDLATE
jgi:Domain of unknown function (DUF4129)